MRLTTETTTRIPLLRCQSGPDSFVRPSNALERNARTRLSALRKSLLLAVLGFCLSTLATPTAPSYGLFRSVDHGTIWAEVGQGLPPETRINALTMVDGRALAGTDAGIFISSEAGEAWRETSQGVPPRTRVHCFALSSGKVFAGTARNGVLVSADGGLSWGPACDGLGDSNVRALTSAGSRVYAGTDSAGVYVLENHGGPWRALRAGLPASPQVTDLAAVGERIFAALYSKGLYRLEDPKAETWVKAGEVRPWQLCVRGTTLFAGHNPGGVWASDDHGRTWREASLGLPENAPIWAFARDGTNVFVSIAGPSGIYVTSDEGRLWSASGLGLSDGTSAVCFAVGEDYILAGVVKGKDASSAQVKATPTPAKPIALTPAEQQRLDLGKSVYEATCLACHQPHGLGQEGLAPPLVGSDWVTGSEQRLVRIALHGLRGPVTVKGKVFEHEMPPLNILDDEQIAAVLSYTRREWGHTASLIEPATVKQIREACAAREEPWTEAELLKVP